MAFKDGMCWLCGLKTKVRGLDYCKECQDWLYAWHESTREVFKELEERSKECIHDFRVVSNTFLCGKCGLIKTFKGEKMDRVIKILEKINFTSDDDRCLVEGNVKLLLDKGLIELTDKTKADCKTDLEKAIEWADGNFLQGFSINEDGKYDYGFGVNKKHYIKIDHKWTEVEPVEPEEEPLTIENLKSMTGISDCMRGIKSGNKTATEIEMDRVAPVETKILINGNLDVDIEAAQVPTTEEIRKRLIKEGCLQEPTGEPIEPEETDVTPVEEPAYCEQELCTHDHVVPMNAINWKCVGCDEIFFQIPHRRKQ
jgi:hypothetical protein